jgi:hypothetical protein
VLEVDVVQLVVVVGAAIGANEHVSAVVTDGGVDDPRRMILALIDQLIVGLRRAEAVIVNRLAR